MKTTFSQEAALGRLSTYCALGTDWAFDGEGVDEEGRAFHKWVTNKGAKVTILVESAENEGGDGG